MTVKDDFYYDVRKELDIKDMCLKDLAQILDISPPYLSDILNGRRGTRARAKYIPKISNYLGIKVLPRDVVRYLGIYKGGETN